MQRREPHKRARGTHVRDLAPFQRRARGCRHCIDGADAVMIQCTLVGGSGRRASRTRARGAWNCERTTCIMEQAARAGVCTVACRSARGLARWRHSCGMHPGGFPHMRSPTHELGPGCGRRVPASAVWGRGGACGRGTHLWAGERPTGAPCGYTAQAVLRRCTSSTRPTHQGRREGACGCLPGDSAAKEGEKQSLLGSETRPLRRKR